MVSINSRNGYYMSMLNIIQGDHIDPSQIHKSLQNIRDKRLVRFVPSLPSSIHILFGVKSPYLQYDHKVSGLMLANHTEMATLFKKTLRQFDKLYKKQAFLTNYSSYALFENQDFGEFDDSKERIIEVMAEYKRAEDPQYLMYYDRLQEEGEEGPGSSSRSRSQEGGLVYDD